MIKMRTALTLFIVLVFVAGCGSTSGSKGLFSEERAHMVARQIKSRGIKDERVLDAISKVPRHEFVPFHLKSIAYTDSPLPIGEGQTISQPYIVALMTELVDLDKNDRVLEIGTGSGYQAAVLAELAREVYTVEIVESLAVRASALLERLNYDNVTVKYGDGFVGWKEYAPFDAIVVTAAPSKVPQPLIEQLAEGGRLVIPVGTHWQELKLLVKTGGKIITTNIIPVRFVPMTGERAESLK
jgi:protein-L-isoaspartate(D-aspartate) O-methyltransferase